MFLVRLVMVFRSRLVADGAGAALRVFTFVMRFGATLVSRVVAVGLDAGRAARLSVAAVRSRTEACLADVVRADRLTAELVRGAVYARCCRDGAVKLELRALPVAPVVAGRAV